MNLCGSGEKVLPDQQYVLGLQDDIIGQFQGLAQVRSWLEAQPGCVSSCRCSLTHAHCQCVMAARA